MRDEMHPTTSTTLSALGVRLYWLIFGNILLVFLAMEIVIEGVVAFSIADVIYGVTLALLVVARYVDVARLDGRTADGDPATMTHFRRYALRVLAAGVAVWGLAHGLAALTS